MDFPVQSSASSSQAKGYATIALASAAGVIVASRMNRPALMLAAGLALSWWHKRSSAVTKPPVDEQQAVIPDLPNEPVPMAEASESASVSGMSEMSAKGSTPLPTFPEAPRRPVEPLINAWDDLRAAISPGVRKAISATEPLPPMPAFVVHSEPEEIEEQTSPPMPKFIISAPSSPLIAADDLDDAVTEPDMHFIPRSVDLSRSILDGISLPIIAEIESTLEAGSGDFMLTETGPNQAPTAPMGHPDSFIVPNANAETESPTVSSLQPPLNSPVKPLADPDVGSRESQSKKTFFDWLRS
jgi:hypothetical protein